MIKLAEEHITHTDHRLGGIANITTKKHKHTHTKVKVITKQYCLSRKKQPQIFYLQMGMFNLGIQTFSNNPNLR